MNDASESWTFSCHDPITPMTAFTRRASLPYFLLLLLGLAAALLLCLPADAQQKADRFRPQVLILVLGGLGPADQCAINYDSVVAIPKAQEDLDVIARAGNWRAIGTAKAETKASGGPHPVPTTSISFAAKGLIGYADGTLPLEPYLLGLKRYKSIEVDYIVPSGFVFQGLKDFENDFVKIQLSQNASSYRYRITIKDSSFQKLDLPLREAEAPKQQASSGSGFGRVAIALVIALLAAALVYFVMMYISKRR